MPIVKYEKGDLLESKLPLIAHGVNCDAVMGAGIARQIAQKWHQSEMKYKEHCWKVGKDNLLGTSLATHEPDDHVVIFHMFTQLHTSTKQREMNYGALARCFSEVNNTLRTMREFDEHMENEALAMSDPNVRHEPIKIPTPMLGIPKIGAGLGGGDWVLIEELINGCTPDINVIVYEL